MIIKDNTGIYCPKAAVFDIDNTITKTITYKELMDSDLVANYYFFDRLITHFAQNVNDYKIPRYCHNLLTLILHEMNCPVEKIKEILTKIENRYTVPVDDVKQTIDLLSSIGIKIYFYTDNIYISSAYKMELAGLREYISNLYVSPPGCKKIVGERSYKHLLNEINLEPEEVINIGDGIADVSDLIPSVLIDSHIKDISKDKYVRARALVTHISDIPQLAAFR